MKYIIKKIRTTDKQKNQYWTGQDWSLNLSEAIIFEAKPEVIQEGIVCKITEDGIFPCGKNAL